MPTLRLLYQDQNKKISGGFILAKLGPNLLIRVSQAVPPGQAIGPEAHDQVVPALIDTGASASCVDNSFAATLGLRVIDRCEVGGVKGKHIHDVFLGKLFIGELGMGMNGRLIGVDLDPNYPVIVGRDFLQNTIMIYDGMVGSITLAR